MLRNWTTVLLSVLLVLGVPTPSEARSAAQEKAPTVQEQIVLLPAGSVVQVKTKAKKTVRGRLGTVSAESFEVQTAKGNNIQKVAFRFDEVRSIQQLRRESGMGTATRITLVVLAGVGVAFLIGIIACAANGCFSY